VLKFTNLLGIEVISALSLVDQNITKEKIPFRKPSCPNLGTLYARSPLGGVMLGKRGC
jgi:hypothetical protein